MDKHARNKMSALRRRCRGNVSSPDAHATDSEDDAKEEGQA